ncbi:helix-turn-helix domain-containing protein [Chryseobacterium sp. MIQD13]|uniref:helix-turn-helix domain-containing protein n=1 Tax=Chryseobacterium sp. MIQD13 TaxID=3422310 RepID=UPI003D2714C1
MNGIYKLIFICFFLLNFQLKAQYSEKEFREILGQIQAAESNSDSAIVIAKSYLPKLKDNKFHLTEMYGVISQNYSRLGKREQALPYAIKANETALMTNDYKTIARFHGLLADQYRNVKLYTKAKETARKGVLSTEKIDDGDGKWIKAALLIEYASILDMEKDNDSSIIYNQLALNTLSQAKTNQQMITYYYAVANSNIGTNYFNKKAMDSAEHYYNKSLGFSKGSFDAAYRKRYAYTNLSLVYNSRKQYQRAIDTLKIIEKEVRPEEYPIKAEVYGYLAQNYMLINDLKNYKKYNELYLNTKDKLSDEEVKAINETLQKLDEDHKRETQKNESHFKMLSIILLLATISIVLLIYYFQKKRKKEKLFYQNYIKTLEEKNLQVKIEEEKVIKKANSSMEITEETEKQIITKLNKFEISDRYLNPNLSLSLLASDLKTNTRYLSEIISRHKGKNFNTYINELRIEYICRNILEDAKFRKYKISALASISGFSSGENFSKIFKKTTGISPSVFIENANNGNKNTA